jgi:hypothetical protein
MKGFEEEVKETPKKIRKSLFKKIQKNQTKKYRLLGKLPFFDMSSFYG